MPDIEKILRYQYRGRLEDALKKGIHSEVLSALPQRWVFQTEQETVTVVITKDCHVDVLSGYFSPDVLVAWEDEYLTEVLWGSHPRDRIAEGRSPYIGILTAKGEEGFEHLAELLALDPLRDKPAEPCVDGDDEFS